MCREARPSLSKGRAFNWCPESVQKHHTRPWRVKAQRTIHIYEEFAPGLWVGQQTADTGLKLKPTCPFIRRAACLARSLPAGIHPMPRMVPVPAVDRARRDGWAQELCVAHLADASTATQPAPPPRAGAPPCSRLPAGLSAPDGPVISVRRH